jgi:vitamin B12 transporter
LYWPLSFGYQGNPDLRPEHSRNAELGVHYASTEQQLDVVYFENQMRDLIDPGITTPVNVNQARNEGVEISYAGQFGEAVLKAALTTQNPRDEKTGQALLRRAKEFGSFSVTQPVGTWRVGGELQYSGAREDNDINTFSRITLSSYTVVNFTATHDLSKRLKLLLRADNVFRQDYMLAHGYNTLGRTLFASINYRS